MYLPIRVVIADDHEIFRNGFKLLFKNQKMIELAGEAEDGQSLVNLVKEVVPDVVITDIQMPGKDGIQACREIQEHFPKLPVIALTTFNDDSYVIDMLEAGARGYLLKNTNQAELLQAVKTVWEGSTYYCNATSQKLARLIAEKRYDPHQEAIHFTERELDVIRLICQQMSNKEIASALKLSPRTVESHREKIQEKIGSRNIAGITIYAIKHKICSI